MTNEQITINGITYDVVNADTPETLEARGHATLMRIEHGESFNVETLLKLATWLQKS